MFDVCVVLPCYMFSCLCCYKWLCFVVVAHVWILILGMLMSPDIGRNNLFVESRVFDLRSMYFEINDSRKHCFPARKRYDLCQNQVNMRQNRPPHLSGDCTMKRPVIKVRPVVSILVSFFGFHDKYSELIRS